MIQSKKKTKTTDVQCHLTRERVETKKQQKKLTDTQY